MPVARSSRVLRLLLLATALFTFLIQSGELGTSDTAHRLQVTHSWWTNAPEVLAGDYPEFGVHGRGGRLYASYGLGQSLLMLPADIVGSAISRLPMWRNYVASGASPQVPDILVSITTNVLVNVLTALAAYHLLMLLGFSVRETVAGVVGLLCATTHLYYAQNLAENNYILLLTITGFALQYRWFVSGDRRALFWGSAALGLNLLTRMTTALDIFSAACFLLFAAVFVLHGTPTKSGESLPIGKRVRSYAQTALPVYAFFFFLDRLYQFVRFGSWTNTYVALMAREHRQMDPTLGVNFPFDGHWLQGGINSGLLGPLISPHKSILLFDPMFPLAVLLAVLVWKRLEPGVRAFFAASLVLLATYIVFYGHYRWWAGDFSWGDRYVSSAVELVALLALPILLRYWKSLQAPIRYLVIGVTAFSFVVQFASLAFWLPLEIYQTEDMGHPGWVVFLRFKNIAAFALNRWNAPELKSLASYEDPWDAIHLTTWNFLPSLLRHVGQAPPWAVHVVYGVWIVVALVLIYVCMKMMRELRQLG